MMKNIIQSFVENNKELFERIVSSKERKHYNDGDVYTILDYQKILSIIRDYGDGYISYRTNTDKQFDAKHILDRTKKMYDSIFTEDGYRRKFKLPEMVQINREYLSLSNELHKLLSDMWKTYEQEPDLELKTFIQLTENQYKKIAKVYKDDMQIWLWLSYIKDCSDSIKKAYRNNNTPVIHKT